MSIPNTLILPAQPTDIDRPAHLFAVMLLAFAGVLSQGLVPFIVQGLTHYAQLTPSQAGLCVGAEMAGSALGIACVLFVLGQMPRRQLAVIALVGVAAGNLLCIGATSAVAYGGARFIAGLGCGLTTAAFGAIATTMRPARNFALFSGSAVVLMSIAQAWIPALWSHGGLPALFSLIAAPALLALVFVPLVPSGARARSRVALASLSPAQRPRALLALLINLAFFTSLAGFWTYVVEIAVSNGNEAGHVTRIVAGGFLFGGIVGSALAALGAARVRPPVLIAANTTIMAAAVIVVVWVPGLPPFIAAAGMFLLFWFTTYPFLMALLAEIDPAGGLTVLGTLVQSVGWLLGPALGSALLAGGSPGRLGLLSTGGFLIASGCASFLARISRRSWAAS